MPTVDSAPASSGLSVGCCGSVARPECSPVTSWVLSKRVSLCATAQSMFCCSWLVISACKLGAFAARHPPDAVDGGLERRHPSSPTRPPCRPLDQRRALALAVLARRSPLPRVRPERRHRRPPHPLLCLLY